MVIAVVSVVITTYIIWFVLSLLASYHRAQRALHWWYGRQSMRMCQEGEAIWDRMLQELFIVRRHLELSSFRTESPQKLEKDCLETLEEFYHSLQKLSEYLYPAYIDDSLPLAIRHLLESWKVPFPALSNIELELPTDWHHEPHERIRVILIALDELLKIKFSEIYPAISIFVSLKSRKRLNELMVQFVYSDSSKRLVSNSQDLDFLCHAFKFLTLGECFYYRQNHKETWHFRWKITQI